MENVAAAPPSAGGAAPLAVADELPVAVPLAEPLAEPLVEPLVDPVAEPDAADEAVRDAELADEPDDAVLFLTELDAAEVAPLAEDDRVTAGPPVGIRLRVVLAGRTSELEGEGSLT
jgi:hypothetical protein